MPASRRSVLQIMILIELKSNPAHSIEDLSIRMGKLRPSVSRSLKLLQNEGLVVRARGGWRVTESGAAEAGRASLQLEAISTNIKNAFESVASPLQEANRAVALMAHDPAMLRMLDSVTRIRLAFPPDAFAAITGNSTQIGKQISDFRNAFVAPSGLTQLARMAVAANEAQFASLNRAIAPLLGLQQQNAAMMANLVDSVQTHPIESFLRTVNLSVTSALEDSLWLRASEITALHSWTPTFPPLTFHLPRINESLGLFIGDELRRLGSFSDDHFIAVPTSRITAAPVATAMYARALRCTIDAGHEDSGGANPGPGSVELAKLLGDLGDDFRNKYEGMWSALNSRHPDYLRHVAISGRELLRTVFEHFVPEADIDADERGALIKPRIKRILGGSDSGTDLVWHLSMGVTGLYRKFNSYTHDDPGDEELLRAIVTAADGVLLFFVIQAHRNSGYGTNGNPL